MKYLLFIFLLTSCGTTENTFSRTDRKKAPKQASVLMEIPKEGTVIIVDGVVLKDKQPRCNETETDNPNQNKGDDYE